MVSHVITFTQIAILLEKILLPLLTSEANISPHLVFKLYYNEHYCCSPFKLLRIEIYFLQTKQLLYSNIRSNSKDLAIELRTVTPDQHLSQSAGHLSQSAWKTEYCAVIIWFHWSIYVYLYLILTHSVMERCPFTSTDSRNISYQCKSVSTPIDTFKILSDVISTKILFKRSQNCLLRWNVYTPTHKHW